MDVNLIFGVHIQKAKEKAEKSLSALTGLMPNVGGPTYWRLLCGVMESIILYGSPIWAETMKMAKYRNTLIAFQRKCAVRIISAYRTVSAVAAQVVAGVVPIDLKMEERCRLHRTGSGHVAEVRMRERAVILREWQAR